MGHFYFKFILSLFRILKPSRKRIEGNEMEKKRQWLLTTTLFISLGLAACESQSVLSQAKPNAQTIKTSTNSTAQTTGTSTYFEASDLTATYDESKASKISLQGTTATVSGDGVTVNGSTVEITKAGTYIVEGTASKVQLKVAAGKEDEVQIVFKNAIIKNTEAPLLVDTAKKVILTLADGTKNEVSDELTSTVKGAVYSDSDLTINGKGSLTVNGAASNAVKSKDGIRIVDATVTTTAKKHGIAANDFINVSGATLNLTADEDGIHSDNEDDVLLGNVYLVNTNITINAGDDGINASNTLLIDEGATIDIQKSEEGLEARLIHQVGGTITVKSTDDGLNAKDWTLESSDEQGPGQQTKKVKSEATNAKNLDQAGDVKIVIDGGTLTVDAEGDGLDANGSIEINGGTIVVNGPTSGANAALDYDDNGILNGGTVLFVDNGQMTMGFGSNSNQAYLMASIQGTAGATVEVVDSSGKTVASLKASKSFSTVLISSPEIKEGENYTIKVESKTTAATASKQAANVGGGPGHGRSGGGQPGQGVPGGRQGR
jgi:hypothetical protein